MKKKHLNTFKARPILLLRKSWRYRIIWGRAILCALIGLTALWFNRFQNFDIRFELRETNKPSDEIILIHISNQELLNWNQDVPTRMMRLKELSRPSDSQFWNPEVWSQFLSQILQASPSAVGVSLYFGDNLPEINSPDLNEVVFNDPRVFWSGRLDEEGRMLLPIFSKSYNNNIVINNFRRDSDGIIRKFSSALVQFPHIALRLASKFDQSIDYATGEAKHINFQGPSGTYKSYRFQDVLEGKVNPKIFKNKIVLVGSLDSDNHLLRTPTGEMTRNELVANVIDNFIDRKWVQRLPQSIYIGVLLFLLIICIYIISNYPHSVSLVFFIWIGITHTAISLWVFDAFYVWLPIASPLVMILAIFILFLGYQLTLKDNKNWKLEQEQKYLYKVEQLKDNFISLFSHDLKTPIAKIQAICDRLITENPDKEIMEDLASLRRESQELHRYIQSILQITKVEAKDFKIIKESSDINEVIESVIHQMEPLANLKGQTIITHLEPLFLVEIDTHLIREVILNLIENAVKYSPLGSKIEVSTTEEDDNVIVSVKDNGSGIPKEEQTKVFEKFYRGYEQLNKTKGSGLGLYLSKYFIELHGGRIYIDSQPGEGSKLSFTIPL